MIPDSFSSHKKLHWPWSVYQQKSDLKGQPSDYRLPKISIVTPSYNQGQFLEETIRSVLLQGYPNLEYIIIDGGSLDSSVEIIRHYQDFITCWVSEKDRGQSAALNKGFSKATGDIFGWVNSDDYLNSGALFEIAKLAEEYPDRIAWVGQSIDIDRSGKEIRKRFTKIGVKSQFGNWGENSDVWLPQPACFFRAETFKKVGGIDENLDYALDVDLWVRISEQGSFAVTNKVIAFERKYGQIKSYQNPPLQQAEHIYINIKNGLRREAESRMKFCQLFALDAMPIQKLIVYVLRRLKGILLRRIRRLKQG